MTIWQDIRFATRTLRRSPALLTVAVVSLALGIGANAFVFSVARGLLLRPLPVPDAQNLAFLQALPGDNHSYPNYVDFRDRAATTVDLAAYHVTQGAVDAGHGAQSSWGYFATGNYFDMLQVQPEVGRFFTSAEDVGRNLAPYVVLSHEYWTSPAFNGDRGVPGRAIRINGRAFTILGVAPQGFHGTEVFFRPDFWVPMTMGPQLEGENWIDSRTAHNVYVAGRLRAGVGQAQAESVLVGIATALRREYPQANASLRVAVTTPGLFGDVVRTPARAFMSVVLVLAGLVLLAACTNLASLLAARVIDRFRALAVRLSLGATRAQLARQLFVETLLLCAAGGAVGMTLAWALLTALTAWRPAVSVPLALDVTPDVAVIGGAAATVVAAALLAVGAAARHAWRADPNTLMRGQTIDVHLRRWTIRDLLLGVQVAVCSLLIVSCLVAIEGARHTFETPLGFNRDGVYVASFDLNQAGYDRTRGMAMRAQLLEAIGALPGIEGATYTTTVPLTTDQSSDDVVRSGAPAGTLGTSANAFTVPPGYFRVMQTRLMSGRDFLATDGRAAIINQTLARQLFGSADATGRSIQRGPGLNPIQVIGVAEDGKYAMPGEAPKPAIYWPALAPPLYESSTQLLLRTSLPADEVARAIRRVFAGLDPALPVAFQGSLREVTSLAFVPAAAAAMTLGTFGVIAITLALTGIYGLSAYCVSARTKEIGIRMAIGGRARQILGTLLGRSAIVLCSGATVGVVLAAAANAWLSFVVYQASSRNPSVVLTSVGLLLLIGLSAVWAPGRRALRVDPAVTLRES